MTVRALLVIALLCVASSAQAETIRLKDGDELSGKVLQDDGESLTIKLPRADVAAIGGKPLGKLMAPAFEAKDLAGAVQRVPDPDGRVVLLQFWATWCPFCRNDMAAVTKLFQRQDQLGVRLISVSVDEDAKALGEFVKRQGIPYPVIPAYAKPSTPAEELPSLYQAKGLPTYIIIDGQGAIVRRLAGSLEASKTNLEDALKPYLASQRPPQ